MFKKFIAGLFLVCLMCGCVSDISDDNDDKDEYNTVTMTNQTFKSDFNKESYIWEGFIFPTNRVMDRK